MANKQNLIPQAHKLTLEEQSNGGKASVKARKNKKMLKECLEILLEKEYTDTKGETMSGAEAMATKLFQQAMKGNLKAFELVRDTAGQKPVEKVITANIEQDVIDEVESIVNEETSG